MHPSTLSCSRPMRRVRLVMSLLALCAGAPLHAQPVELPAPAAAAQAEAGNGQGNGQGNGNGNGNGVRPDKGAGNGLKPPGLRVDEVSRGPARPRHYPSTALPPVPEPPRKR